jgi:agmatinase
VQDSINLGFEVLTANELHEIGIAEAGKRIRERVKDSKVFLSFDIDFVDPSCAPGTGTIEIGGFTGYESLKLVREMRDLNLSEWILWKFCLPSIRRESQLIWQPM